MELVYRPVIGMAKALFTVMGWPMDVRGTEHIPAHGPGVVASNHVSYLDFTFIGYGADRRRRLLRFLAKQEIFDHPVAGPLMRGMHHIPVDRFGRASDSYRAAVEALQRGELIGMFPEATISISFVPAAAKSGAARMAMTAGVPLIPAATWGGQRVLTKGRKPSLRRGVPISIAYGPSVAYAPDDDPGAVTRRLMTAITALVDELADAYPHRPRGAADGWWQPAHLGGSAPSVEEAQAFAERQRAERKARRAARVGGDTEPA